MNNIYTQLQTLGIVLPPVATPAAAYVPFVVQGDWIYLSGHIAKKEGRAHTGQLGLSMSTAEGYEAAKGVAIDLLGTLHAACLSVGQDLNHIDKIVKVMSLVNSTAQSPSNTWSPMAAVSCSAPCLAREANMPARPLGLPNCPWVRVLRLNSWPL